MPKIGTLSRLTAAIVSAIAVLVVFAAPPLRAQPPPAAPAATPAQPAEAPAVGAAEGGPDTSTVDPARRDRVLPRGWRASADLAMTTAGDSTGLNLLVAAARDGYTWRTAARLSEPGIEADQWIGNACLTGSGRRALVVYEPRHFTNRPHLFDRGAFAAVVDLASGRVTKLGVNVSIAYHNPGCGAGETAVLTQGGASVGRTRLHVVDTARGAITRRHELRGQLTSAVPHAGGVAAVRAGRIIGVDRSGATTTLAVTGGATAYLRSDSRGGLAFLERESAATAVVRYLAAGGRTAGEIARGGVGRVGLARGAGGRVFVTGDAELTGASPATVTRLAVPARAEVSSLGALAVVHRDASGRSGSAGVGLRATVPATGERIDFAVPPATRSARLIDSGRQPSPALSAEGSVGTQAVGSPTDPVDADRSCSVPRNDVRTQIEQPHWRQVEWAANLAIQGGLTFQRPANWRESGLPAWTPQQMLPPVALAGGGRVPAQVLLGILAQESNLWQASWHALEGVPANPLVGMFYGTRDSWTINWSEADCGYGVAQVTDGMRLAGQEKPGETSRDATEQRAIAVDYATNIAAGLRILQQKWNQTYTAGIRMNDADPSRPENWFAAVWAYNTGVNPQAITGNTTGCTPGPSCTDDRGNWGLGWSNNPANPDYPFDRDPFLNGVSGEGSPVDAKYPQRWPYPEKVMGWAAFPIIKADFRDPDFYEGGYFQAWWATNADRTAVKPPLDAFCGYHNNCAVLGGEGDCGYSDFHCWWHEPVTWKPLCSITCGHENLRFALGSAEPARGTHYPPVCTTSGLPSGALIVDDVADSVPLVRSDRCSTPTTNRGTFTWQFNGVNGKYPAKMDVHQVGGGIDGHFWFSHEYDTADDQAHKIKATGTWTLGQTMYGWARVLVHMPVYGAHSQQAHYRVDRGASATPASTRYKTRVLPQRHGANRWVSLGVFDFRGTPKVSLSNIARNATGRGVEDVAWDAIAFQPLPAKPSSFVVHLGDSYSSGEGAATQAEVDYTHESNHSGDGNADYRNGCHRSRHAWSRKAWLRDDTLRSIGERADSHAASMDYHLLACSGAQTENLLPSRTDPISGRSIIDPVTGTGYVNAWGEPAQGQYRELSQLDKGFLDENTTLVTLSIGGNDARFGDVLKKCVLVGVPLDPCMNEWMDGQPIGTLVPELINGRMRDSVVVTLRAVAQLAPNAKIILMGYPELFSDDLDCLSSVGLGISGPEATWMNEQGRNMAASLGVAVSNSQAVGIRVRAADPIINGDFGGQGICGEPEAIHRLIIEKTAGEDPDAPVSAQSVHPNLLGTTNYATTLNRELRNWGL